MRELRLHREIYAGAAVDAALQVYAKYGRFERAEEAAHWVVRVSAKTPARERRVALELANYALGLTRRAGVTP